MDRYRTLRWISYFSELIIFYIVQTTSGLLPAIMGERPVLLISTALTVAMFEGEVGGIGIGLVAGLLIDFSAGGTLGFHAILLVIVCFFAGILTTNLIRTNLFTALILAAVAIPLFYTMHWLFYYVIWGYGSAGYVFVRHILPRMLYTLLTVPVVYFFNRAIGHRLRENV